jgi:hypothetical protein
LDLSPEFSAKSDIFAEGEFDRAVELDVCSLRNAGDMAVGALVFLKLGSVSTRSILLASWFILLER